jgi:Holliday junction resolvasome RuvABC endonuclease subunit
LNTDYSIEKYDYVAFEDYSFSSKGQVFSIAESTGILKKIFFENNSKMRLYSVPSIKMYFTEKGNADKVLMEDFYEKHEDKFDLSFLPNVYENKSNNPADNIVDAFAILKMLITELKLRNNILDQSSLTDKQISIFLDKNIGKSAKSKKKEEIPYCMKEFIQYANFKI